MQIMSRAGTARMGGVRQAQSPLDFKRSSCIWATREGAVSVDQFREGLLQVMERKEHWAWSAFGSGLVPKGKLHVHFEQEYATYVRDFPVLVARAYVQCPIAA